MVLVFGGVCVCVFTPVKILLVWAILQAFKTWGAHCGFIAQTSVDLGACGLAMADRPQASESLPCIGGTELWGQLPCVDVWGCSPGPWLQGWSPSATGFVSRLRAQLSAGVSLLEHLTQTLGGEQRKGLLRWSPLPWLPVCMWHPHPCCEMSALRVLGSGGQAIGLDAKAQVAVLQE